MDKKKKGISKSLVISLIVIFILIPLTVVVSYIVGDTNLYIASVIIMILAMIPFFMNFENKKPDARGMSILAVMTAIAVVSRVAFIWLPSFKPMGGVIIITALAFGPQAGFMCGALSMIVSNIIFGQGPWTPWQMFCYGMIGFIGGLLAKRRIISERHSIRSATITFIIVFILSGLVLDTCSVFLMRQYGSVSALAIYAAGVPYNIPNAISSALCVLILSKPLIMIINRLKLKYGLNELF